MAPRVGKRQEHRGTGDAGRRQTAVSRQRGLRWVAGTVLLGLVSVGVPQGAFAAGVVGTGTPESCTEAALDAALVDGGSVTFNCGNSPVTLPLTTTRAIGGDTSLDGGGLITLSGSGTVQLFVVNAGATLDLDSLTIANGQSGPGGGGGVHNEGRLIVANTTFTRNTAAEGDGGAIWNIGTVGVTDSTFSANGAADGDNGGGAIYNEGTLTVTGSAFSGNGTNSQGGGAIYNDGSLTATRSTFSHNTARDGDGGAISNEAARLVTVNNCTFSANRATGGDYGGGAIANAGSLAVTDSTFAGNSAVDGGIGGGAIFTVGTLKVTSSTLSGNVVVEGGGGAIANGGRLTVTDSTFAGNSATSDFYITSGGGVWNVGTLKVINCSFSGNRAVSGGAIGNDEILLGEAGTLTVTNSLIANSRDGGDCVAIAGTVIDGGHNLIEDAANSCGLMNGENGNLVGIDPELDPTGLTDNGGLTHTIALLPGSPAINAGDAQVCADPPVNGVDQRGYVRPGSGYATCSIGAYEHNSPGPPCDVGDCNQDSAVTVAEIITLVNIALGTALPAVCPHGVPSGAEVNVALIIGAVNNALNGCAGVPPPTPTSTPPSTRTPTVTPATSV